MMNNRLRIVIYIFALGFVYGFSSDLHAQIWERANATHRSAQITPDGGESIFSIAGHLFHSADLGNTFTVLFPDAGITGFAIGSTGIFYVSSPKGLDTTTDPINGTWVTLPASNVPPITCLFVRASADATGEDDIFAGTASGIWYRKSNDTVWQKKHDAGDGAPILQIAALNKNIYYRTMTTAFASHDRGATWKSISPSTNGSITSIVTTSETDVYVAVSGNPNSLVLHSTDGGGTFNGPRGTSFSSHTIQVLVANAQGDLFLGGGVRDAVNQDSITQGFVFRFLSNGAGWEDYSLGLPSSPPTPEVIAMGFSSAGKVFASTDSAGLWRTVLPSGVRLQPNLSGIMLSQNYPNPANSSTEFSVTTDQEINASVEVFDAIGRNILQIANGNITQGTHFFTVDTKNMSNGTYFYRLQTPEIILTKSFIVDK